ncbi:MAG: transporter substrate-binding domain-containing protein [Caldilineales bacterium]|nr:transporter substrate-binding domain-containing protein [Caldilineales bacterium]
MAACGGRRTEPTVPPPTNTPRPLAATSEPAAPQDDAWARIQADGKINVGTSVDYPPFEYFDEDYVIDGFDIALMQAIADELGLDMELSDIAFAGLGAAVNLGQIDVAIAAISITPEREREFDFSHIYFVSEDAYVAAKDTRVGRINDFADLAKYTLGVQRGSIYQDMIEDELVDTGLMPETNVFVYGQLEQAIPDVEEGRVDILVMDKPVAEAAVANVGGKIVASDLHRETFAIGMANGQQNLRKEINQVLVQLQRDGVIAELAKKYMDLDPNEIIPVPTPTPEPDQPEPTPPPSGCLDGMAYVADLNYDDNNMKNPPVVQPGAAFQKGWRVRNTGTCTWNSNYTLVYVDGNNPASQMGGLPTSVQGEVPPGAEYDIYVNLFAPLQPGVYKGIWQMTNAQSKAFGERIYVGIQVPANPTPTPAPTSTPSANVNFWTDNANIQGGQCTTNHWTTQNVQAVYYYQQGQNWQDHGVAGNGDSQECPHQTTTYYLRVVERNNSVDERQLTIQVQQNVAAPSIRFFNSDPSGQIGAGQCVNLTWEVNGNVNAVQLLRNNSALWANAPFRGSYKDCPPVGQMSYVLQATGPGGTSKSTQNVNVVQGQPTATPAPGPVINSFTVTPQQINSGQCVLIAWSTGGGTTVTRILRNSTIVQQNAGLQGSLNDCLSDFGVTTYTLQAANAAGQATSANASVSVVQSAPPTDTPLPQPTATSAPQPPTIVFFAVTSDGTNPVSQINAGQCVFLTWQYEGQDLAASSITRNGELLESDPPAQGSYQDCPPVGQMNYQLSVSSEFGGAATRDASLTVVGG